LVTATLRQPEDGESTGPRIGAVSVRYSRPDGVHPVVVELDAGTTRVLGGRRPPADVVIDDPSISAAHFELEFVGAKIVLRDLGSTNGTWIYDVRVREAELALGSRFTAGAVVVEVERVDRIEVAIAQRSELHGLLGTSEPMKRVYAVIERLGRAALDVLVHGETGTGKELVARAIHLQSPRARGPFIVLDCSTLPRELAEATILGHAAGAFTGATRARSGCFEDANGGTVFLDEIGELPLDLQSKLLRVVSERSVTRLGETTARPVDVRIVAATHRDLRKMVLDDGFREDLFYRLVQFTAELPPLRERGQDIVLLARTFLAQFSGDGGPGGPSGPGGPGGPDDGVRPAGYARDFSPAAIARLRGHSWPGNVRELRNVIMRAAQMSTGAVIEPADLALATAEIGRVADVVIGGGAAMPLPIEVARTRFEREYVAALLAHADRNVSRAARVAGMSRRGLYAMMARLGLGGGEESTRDGEDERAGDDGPSS